MHRALFALACLPVFFLPLSATATSRPGAGELNLARYGWLYSRYPNGEEAYCPLTKAVRCKSVREHPGRYWCTYRERSGARSTWVKKRTQIAPTGTLWNWMAGDTPEGCAINLPPKEPG